MPPRLSAVLAELGVEGSPGEFAANIGGLWYPAMDDIACVLPGDGATLGPDGGPDPGRIV
jgi:hypothetical protein